MDLQDRKTRDNQLNSPLLRLPADLREAIYKYALEDQVIVVALESRSSVSSKNHVSAAENSTTPFRRQNMPAFLYTCRELHFEVSPLVSAHCAFQFDSSLILDAQVNAHFAGIRTLQITTETLRWWLGMSTWEIPRPPCHVSTMHADSDFPVLRECRVDIGPFEGLGFKVFIRRTVERMLGKKNLAMVYFGKEKRLE